MGFIFLLWAQVSHAATLTITDDSNTEVIFTTPPQRIISLAPNLTELTYAVDMGNRLVAVSAYSDYPPPALQLPQVGDAFRLDWEHLLALKPDLILAWGSGLSAQDRALFKKFGLKIVVLEPHRLDDIPRILRLLGKISGTPKAAETAARTFEQQRHRLHQRYAAASDPTKQNKFLPVRAYFQIAANPLLTINRNHIISDVLQLCGAHNIFADAPVLVPTLSEEALINAQPQIMLSLATTPAQEEIIKAQWRTLPLRSTQHPQALHTGFIHPDLISRASPRILLGAAQLCEIVASSRH